MYFTDVSIVLIGSGLTRLISRVSPNSVACLKTRLIPVPASPKLNFAHLAFRLQNCLSLDTASSVTVTKICRII